MVDEFKALRDSLFKTLTNLSVATRDDEEDKESPGMLTHDEDELPMPSLIDAKAAKALMGALFAKAGKSKDEIVQILAREIGLTMAAMLKEPLAQIAKHQKLQISLELVPKTSGDRESGKDHRGGRSGGRKKRYTKRSSHRSKVGKSGG